MQSSSRSGTKWPKLKKWRIMNILRGRWRSFARSDISKILRKRSYREKILIVWALLAAREVIKIKWICNEKTVIIFCRVFYHIHPNQSAIKSLFLDHKIRVIRYPSHFYVRDYSGWYFLLMLYNEIEKINVKVKVSILFFITCKMIKR